MRSKCRARAYATYDKIAEAIEARMSSALRMLTTVDAGPTIAVGIRLAAVGDGVGVGNADVGIAVGVNVTAGVGENGTSVEVGVDMPGTTGIFRTIPERNRVVVVMSFAFVINGYFAPLPYIFCAMIQRLSPG